MRKVIVPFLLILFVAAGVTTASGQWRVLGTRDVNFRVDHDTFPVTYKKGDFRELKIAVVKAPVHFDRVMVTFRNGQTQDLEFRDLIEPGGETRAIDLEGNERIIRKVDFWYQTDSARKRGKVILYGRS